MKRLIIFLTIPLLFTACSNIFESDGTYYYDVKGEGYVYYHDTNEPVPYAKVGVYTQFKYKKGLTKYPIWEFYHADEIGCFRVKFPRRVDGENAVSSCVHALVEDMSSINKGCYNDKDFNKRKKNIQIGIIYVKPSYLKNTYEYNK